MFLEGLILLVVVLAVVLAIRPSKSATPESPVIIDQPGHYHMTLAPNLGVVHPFLEGIVSEFESDDMVAGDIPTQYFEVRDSALPEFYLLGMGLRNGVLYFQAINPVRLLKDADSHRSTIRQFSEQVMLHHPVIQSAGIEVEQHLCASIMAVASNQGIKCIRL